MIYIANILHPAHIDLNLSVSSQEEAIYQVAAQLKEDERVRDWNGFYASLTSKTACLATGQDFEIYIPHARTDAVSSMVMSVGRSGGPAALQDRVRYIFVVGVPIAMAADYLRIIGALARTFKNPAAEPILRVQSTPETFLKLLSEWEIRL